MIDQLFPPVVGDDEFERAARARALAALRDAVASRAGERGGAARDEVAGSEAPRREPVGRAAARPRARKSRDGGSPRKRSSQEGFRGHPPATLPRDATRRTASPRWLLAPAALAIAAGAVIALSSGVDDGQIAPTPSAAALLTRAADAARTAPAPGALAPGEYLYVRRTAMEPKRITRGGERFTVFIRYVQEDWTARDGSGRSRARPAKPSFPSVRDKAAYERAGSPSNRTMVGNYLPILDGTDVTSPARPRRAFPARSTFAMSYRQVRALSANPVALEQRLRAETGSLREIDAASRDAMARLRLLERIGGLLAGAPLDAAQRAALFEVAAGILGCVCLRTRSTASAAAAPRSGSRRGSSSTPHARPTASSRRRARSRSCSTPRAVPCSGPASRSRTPAGVRSATMARSTRPRCGGKRPRGLLRNGRRP